jgi:uncharacterized membrane protein
LSWGATTLFSLGVALYGYHYLLPRVVIPPGVGDNPMARPWLFVHAGFAATALLLGPTQFLPHLRRAWPRLHRWMGRTYVFACLTGGAAGLILATGTTAGPIASAGFGLLAITWLAVTAQAWRLAMGRRFDEHRRWMFRSFALTLAAVTLRIYLPLVAVSQLPFLESYRAISFLCWVPNLVLAELYLMRGRLRPAEPARA